MEFLNGEADRARFGYFRQPEIQLIRPLAADTAGGKAIRIFCKHLKEHDGTAQVAFSNGMTTKVVKGSVSGGHIDCTVPAFPVGPCQVNIALYEQQFTGTWNETGDCISK